MADAAKAEKKRAEEKIAELEEAKKVLVESGTATMEQLEAAQAQITDYKARYAEMEARVAEVQARTPSTRLRDPSVIVPEGCEMVSGEPYNKLPEYLRLHYDEGAQRFTLKINTGQIESVDVSHQLAYMLGFEGNTFTVDRTEAKYMPDLHGGIHSLYIHAPKLVESSMVGDTWAPLLRIAKVKGGPGDFVEDVFLTPQYHKVLEKQVSEISVQIRTSTGRLVPFNWGNATLVLHFKKLSLY